MIRGRMRSRRINPKGRAAALFATGLLSVVLGSVAIGVVGTAFLFIRWLIHGEPPWAVDATRGQSDAAPTTLLEAIAISFVLGLLFMAPSWFISARSWAACGRVACPAALLLVLAPEMVLDTTLSGAGLLSHVAMLCAVSIGPCVGGAMGDRCRKRRAWRPTETSLHGKQPRERLETGNPYQP